MEYNKNFGTGNLDATWMATQKAAVTSKFQQDQKNCEE
jgi:hypothetical protein